VEDGGRIRPRRAAIIHTGVVWTQWGNGARVTQLGLVFVAYAIVTLALGRFWDREAADVATAKFLTNVALTLLAGHLSSWSIPAFLYLPFHALARDRARPPTISTSKWRPRPASCSPI
jgi:hypothetical protein